MRRQKLLLLLLSHPNEAIFRAVWRLHPVITYVYTKIFHHLQGKKAVFYS